MAVSSIEELKLELALAKLRNKQSSERKALEDALAVELKSSSGADEVKKKKRTWYEWLLNIEIE